MAASAGAYDLVLERFRMVFRFVTGLRTFCANSQSIVCHFLSLPFLLCFHLFIYSWLSHRFCGALLPLFFPGVLFLSEHG